MVTEEVVQEDHFKQTCDDLVALNHYVDTVTHRITSDGKREDREVRMRCAEYYARLHDDDDDDDIDYDAEGPWCVCSLHRVVDDDQWIFGAVVDTWESVLESYELAAQQPARWVSYCRQLPVRRNKQVLANSIN